MAVIKLSLKTEANFQNHAKLNLNVAMVTKPIDIIVHVACKLK